MNAKIHAVIISWDGQGPNAGRIAAAISPAVERLTVIYSNYGGLTENGDGVWVQVPQDWYFGRKFAECLRHHRGEETLLQIQADAMSRNWPGVVGHLRAALATTPNLGVWAPDIHISPYPNDVAVLRRKSGATFEVAQTDGIVWALTYPIIERLTKLDFEPNNIGWGIDWAAISSARVLGNIVLRDTAVCVEHPPSRGYSENDAKLQMERFLDQLALDERAEAHWCQQIVATRKAHWIGTMRWPLLSQAGVAEVITTSALHTAISDIWIVRGRVLVHGPPDLEQTNFALEAGDGQYTFRPLAEDPILNEIPLIFELEPHVAGTHRFEIISNSWGTTSSLKTARLSMLLPEKPLSVPLGPPVIIPAGTEVLQLGAALAACGMSGRLVLQLTDLEDEQCGYIPLYPDETDKRDGWQMVKVGRIPFAPHPRKATLRLECSSLPGPADHQPSCLLAIPHIARATMQPDLVWPTRLRGACTDGKRCFVSDPGPMPADVNVTLVFGNMREKIIKSRPKIFARLRENMLVSEHKRTTPNVCVLWLDGIPAFVVNAKAVHDGIKIPRRAGGSQVVELRDATGSQILWSSVWTTPRKKGFLTRIRSLARAWNKS